MQSLAVRTATACASIGHPHVSDSTVFAVPVDQLCSRDRNESNTIEIANTTGKFAMRVVTPLLISLAATLTVGLASCTIPSVTPASGASAEPGAISLTNAPSAVAPHAPGRSIFGPTSAWRVRVKSAPLAPDSATLVATLAAQVNDHWGGVAAFNVNRYAISTYTVGRSTPRNRVHWDNCQNRSYLPDQLYELEHGAAFRHVPIPRDAVTSPGDDSHLAVYDRDTDQLWEFWRARKVEGKWRACWGGRIDHVRQSPGYFEDGMGASATGLSMVGGAVSIKDVKRGRIDHAISLNVVEAAHWSDFSYPAQRSDGSLPAGTPGAIQEGRRFRLKSSVNIGRLNLHPIAAMVARAAKRYGFVVNDRGGAVAIIGESGAATSASTGTDPWVSTLSGTPDYAVMKGFPWTELEALPMNFKN